jgi:arylsulfatase A-like enzyme
MNTHRTLVPVLGALSIAAVGGCSSGPGTMAESVQVDNEAVVTATESNNVPPQPRVDPVTELARTAELQVSVTEQHHFADRVVDGVYELDMGTTASRRAINGGWRSGWNPTPRFDNASGADYFETNTKVVRVFFEHQRGGFDRIVVRMRAAKQSNKVSFHLNGNPLSATRLTDTWEDIELAVPKDFTRDGENQLLMRFSWDTRQDGRVQVSHVDRISVLAPEARLTRPTKLAPTRVTRGGVERVALVADRPQTVRARVDLPQGSPQLAVSWGATKPGAQLAISVHSDEVDGPRVLSVGPAPDDLAWSRQVLSLQEFAGQVVELQVEVGGEWGPGQEVAWDTAVYLPTATGDRAPTGEVRAKNVLVFLVDTLRYDKLGLNNPSSSVPTPNFDRFAADATVFDAAYDTENWTKPSTASILTGLYPDTHRTKEGSSKLPTSIPMVSEHLQKQNLRTGAFIANGYVSDAFGFKRGWDSYTNYIREEKVTNAERVVDDALGWIDKQGENRWFAYVHTIDPHVPYSAPDEWKLAQWKGGKYGGALRAQNTGDQIAEIKSKRMKVDKSDMAYLEALYDGEVAYNDHHFGRMIDGLQAMGLYEDTLVVVLADHGEEFWDHGSVGHGHSLYDEMVHTALLVRCPGSVTHGSRQSAVLSTSGLVPTMTDVLGLEPISGAEGASWAPILAGSAPVQPRVGVSDFLFRKKAVRVGPYHWLTNGQDGKLFNVLADRHERKDLAGSHPIAWAFARTNFGIFYGAADKAKWWGDETGDDRQELKPEVADIDPELQQQLEAMGYVGGATSEQSAEEDRELMEQEDN